MKLSINILTWNNSDTVIRLLDNVLNDVKDMEHEFILVDNGSDDGTVDLINNWITLNLSDNFTFIKNDVNLGISVGKNQAMDLSKGKYIFMVDGDVIPVPNSIKLLVKRMDKGDIDAIGMLPNKFATSPDMAESFCKELVGEKKYKCCCLYYGLFKRSSLKGLRMNTEGEMGKPGYGWEDHDFYQRMKKAGIEQYAVNINTERGRYYHNINSSIRAMGHEKYATTSRARSKQFKEIWGDATRQGSDKPSGKTG